MSDAIALSAAQSLSVRRMIDALRADDSLYEACPEIVRSVIADLVLPPMMPAEHLIADVRNQVAENIRLLERFGARIRELEQRLAGIGGDVFVPGEWRCPKCAFRLSQFTLFAESGGVGRRDDPGEKCPNCTTPLWRVSALEDRNEAIAAANKEAEIGVRLKASLQRMCEAFKPFRLKPIGASGSEAHQQQDEQIAAHAEAAALIFDLSPQRSA